ncbi:AraC family transcriptional regulator [Saccharomonospora sp. CUA-673]|uniref:GlxA family transcriptional regulator n=1 Tax=Saccharomonospora sp. CUA-673 TaxID=1904969 RepID=UPI0009647DD5|nr:helix-turn-helix domain-containing protein [Saccharomonospora sp. CUA-673]OLT38748.1 AraC family transcriptional regulator [Saccharomonospora sp. CUA-673]
MTRVGLVLHEQAMLYETAIAAEVFGVDRGDLTPAGKWYDFATYTPDGTPSAWLPGAAARPYEALAEVDTVLVPSVDDVDAQPDPALVDAVTAAHAAGARIAALCTGTFVLAAAGLLDDRHATTHWMHADALAARFPHIGVRADVLYTSDGSVFTSAGKTAALDLCLHLVYTDFGATVANGLARRLVTPAYRAGGQAQFVASPADPGVGDRLGDALAWARARLDRPITVRQLAEQAAMSTRQLARRMHAEVGSGPLDWLHRERIRRAQELLERTDASVEQIANRCGMGTATTLRRHFVRTLGVTPTTYRTVFRTPRRDD